MGLNQIKILGAKSNVYPNGDHRTLQVKKVKNGYLKDQLIIGYLSGSDNTSSYTFFGVLNRGQIHFWNTWMKNVGYDELKVQRIRRAISIINGNPDEFGKTYALNSGNCYVCNRLLTHPESLSTGIGPECSKKKASRKAA